MSISLGERVDSYPADEEKTYTFFIGRVKKIANRSLYLH